VADANTSNARTPIFEEMRSEMPTGPYEPLPDASMPVPPVAAGPRRTKRARDYEQKVTGLLNSAMRVTAGTETTVSDAAALIVHGDVLASKVGDLADVDPRVRRAVDFITSGTENPYLAVVMAALPLAAQIVRNHETESTVRVGVKIPFTKRRVNIPFRFALRNKLLRSFTRAPKTLADSVFTEPKVKNALLSARIDVAYPGYQLEEF
jgi:hypothetical protein